MIAAEYGRVPLPTVPAKRDAADGRWLRSPLATVHRSATTGKSTGPNKPAAWLCVPIVSRLGEIAEERSAKGRSRLGGLAERVGARSIPIPPSRRGASLVAAERARRGQASGPPTARRPIDQQQAVGCPGRVISFAATGTRVSSYPAAPVTGRHGWVGAVIKQARTIFRFGLARSWHVDR